MNISRRQVLGGALGLVVATAAHGLGFIRRGIRNIRFAIVRSEPLQQPSVPSLDSFETEAESAQSVQPIAGS
jgi:hypothetical protein